MRYLSDTKAAGAYVTCEGQLTIQQASRISPPAVAGVPYTVVHDNPTTNLVPNPSFEVNTTGWSAFGDASISRVTDWKAVGTASCHVSVTSPNEDSGVRTDAISISTTTGEPFALSMWLRASSRATDPIADSEKVFVGLEWLEADNDPISTVTASLVLLDKWDRYAVLPSAGYFSAPANAAKVKVRVNVINGALSQSIHIDGVQLEQGRKYPTSYCDGSMGHGYSWESTAHASKSSRVGGRLDIKAPNATAAPFMLSENGALHAMGMVPIGSIVAWFAYVTSTLPPDSGFVRCEGQTLSDADSPLDGVVIPDLNDGQFLRGAGSTVTAAYVTRSDNVRSHTHSMSHTHSIDHPHTLDTSGAGGKTTVVSTSIVSSGTTANLVNDFSGPSGAASTANTGTPSTGSGGSPDETYPKHMDVLWIMRVK